MSVLFEQLWKCALPLGLPADQNAVADAGPDADDRHLLCLLTAGLTDEAIAKQLGISLRTLQRRLRALLDRLHARTRFQAALRAAALGWVPMDSAEMTHPGAGADCDDGSGAAQSAVRSLSA